MKAIIKKWYDRLSFPAEWNASFNSLLENAELCPCTVSEYDNSTYDKQKNLLMYLYFCEELSNRYATLEIPENTLYDTLSDVVIWAKVHFDINGELGLTEVNWLRRHFSVQLFRLGRLQFCMADGELEIHIPDGEPFTPDKCRESLTLAKSFFAKYFPDFRYDKFTCHSWLLDDTLLNFVRPDSNIASFMRMFDIKSREESFDALKYVFRFDARRETLSDFTPKTGLAKKLYDYVQGGGKLYCSLGEICIK